MRKISRARVLSSVTGKAVMRGNVGHALAASSPLRQTRRHIPSKGQPMRPSGRAPDEMRAIDIITGFTRHAEGSVLVSFGDTRVLCTASIEEKIPPFLRGKGEGWVT